MSELALIKAGFGNGGRSRGIRHFSEATAWKVSVEVPKVVTSKFYSLTRHPGPFEEDKKVIIAKHFAVNTGNKEGKVYVDVAELDVNGAIIDERSGNMTIVPGRCCANECTREYNKWIDCDFYEASCSEYGGLTQMKKKAGTYYFGIRTYGEDEDKPAYPKPETLEMPTTKMLSEAPTAPPEAFAAPEKWCTPAVGPIPEICLEPWQWAAVAGAGIGALVLTYAGVRTVRGKPVI